MNQTPPLPGTIHFKAQRPNDPLQRATQFTLSLEVATPAPENEGVVGALAMYTP